ncbi:Beta-D-xylosidase [Quillaja saponaria]|uniref:Beta-D-xylosidase n=1 Tax=Quillaja saponaria TaxID=32244 RepID=A0AAD7M4K5_QUISA|nr:Beta-D-xylosidase [Quillaja saponaria]
MSKFAYCDSSLPFAVRVKDLVDRMTLMEKINQLGNKAFGVPRIGLAKYEWWSEALHGVSNVGPGTYFDDLIPDGGRITETPGEDPFVVGTYASNYVRGLQDVEGTENVTDFNSRPLKVSACCKHYAAYDVDNWLAVDRYHFDARVTEQDMVETFLRPFEMCVKDGDVSSVMCSYNRVNGIPTCADPRLLKDTIRGDWDLHGYIVSDCDSIEVLVDNHKWLGDSKEDAVAQTLKAGLDLDCGEYYTNFTGPAAKQGKVREEDIDKSLKYLYTVLMRLGFFDGSPSFKSLGKNDVCSDKNIELATEAAREGLVLLKNNKTLPLHPSKFQNLAVVGPHANATSAMIGNYAGIPCQITAPIDGFAKYAKVIFEMGCGEILCKNESFIFSAMKAAKKADATVILAGLDLSVEQESLDREDLLLPGYQTQLINQVAAVSKGPVILVIMSAGGIDISFAKENENIKAILWAGYPGEEGGQAIADVVFGKYNPGGRLPLTWHEADYVDLLPMTSMPLRPIDSLGYPGRTHKFFNGSTVYPFGYGLSYTQFNYSLASSQRSLHINLTKFHHCRDLIYDSDAYKPSCPAVLTNDIECNNYNFEFEIEIQNVGDRDGSEVVLVYSKPPKGIADAPLKQMIGFNRVFVKAGKNEKVKFVFNACKSLGIVDYKAYHLLPSGQHTIMVGDDVVSYPIQVSFQE